MTYYADIHWSLNGGDFAKGRYSRAHTWQFDGGQIIPASPSPHIVPAPWSDAQAVDPEEAFVAALSSCHMLTFLWLASKAGFIAQAYHDRAEGEMACNPNGQQWVSRVTLYPAVQWTGQAPDAATLEALHHQAHEECFIAQSVKTEVLCQPRQYIY
ncbi:OsmC family peroxiredoxin [Lampropedia puyangensis]|uniref:OsmC family peroxiredoxin n=1 Tax=Lampropedia puyangensis TaxID=1330072 RepID=A0A4V4GQT2_9BURK|nr:OsmC family protein [Lampropedia puyangensis]THT98735.1 OsmC family peroxiredoxin [Lampropedia puyangensis]